MEDIRQLKIEQNKQKIPTTFTRKATNLLENDENSYISPRASRNSEMQNTLRLY